MNVSIRGLAAAALLAAAMVRPVAAEGITLHGAVQFGDDHTFNKTLLRFEDLTRKYYGKPVTSSCSIATASWVARKTTSPT